MFKNLKRKLYSDIEYLIIRWGNDGTKTAGTLTREIMKLLNKKFKYLKYIFISIFLIIILIVIELIRIFFI
jgi:hypothetical protein